ncbi:LLM class flavin-dependent oxidoreductase [Agromyces sp. MMS24-JH15]|uniref:LLM class flavin-dependent oxidoreductase n=1 Tax=Agromyces sp. MMS24-JH15 TaxID=3243765 RepID=UPI00374A07A0
MPIELVGGVLSAPVSGDDLPERRARNFTPDPRAREVLPEHIAWQAALDEADGYDRALVHLYSAWADPALVGAWAAAATSRIGITVAHRPGVTEPTVAARQFATLDRLSGGRAGVHIVIGSSDEDVRRDGDRLGKRDRYRRAGEYLEVFTRALLSDEPFDHEGEFYRVEDAWTGFRPAASPRPPISVGGSSPEAKELAARHADVYAGTYPTAGAAAAVVAEVDALAAAHGRRLGYWKQFFVHAADTDREAREDAAELRARAHAVVARTPVDVLAASAQFARARERELASERDLRAAGAAYVDRVFDGLLVGSVERVAEEIDAYRRAGVETLHVVGLIESEDDRRVRRRLVEEVRRQAV